MVKLGEVANAMAPRLQKLKIPLFLGKDVKGAPLAFDLAEMPHLLIAGRTGTGKSVCLNAMILSILMTKRPDEVKLILIDPKMVELSQFKRIPHLMHPVVTDMKKAESLLVRLAQKARAVGMHLIVATQKPTVDVITGLIKGNLPARIAFEVASRGDSRVVLDEMGADRLLGNGDMLFLIPGTSHIVRAQGTYVSDLEVNRVCAYLEQYPVEFSKELVGL